MSRINPIQLQKFLKGMDYPSRKQDLITFAQQNGADENALSVDQLPDDEYQTPTDVSEAVSKVS